MNGNRPNRPVRGVSLIEALVALAVMAVGMLGVVGMQTSLRFNADVSRQRAEAVRMAQEKMEELRAFGVLSGAVAGENDYTKIITGTDTPSVPSGFGNTTFSRTVTVPPTVAVDPRFKVVQVTVSWLDRRTAAGGMPESVTLTSFIAQVAPVLGASLGLPGDRAGPQRPLGRHRAIPHGAADLQDGRSRFTPPGAVSGVSWIFNNASGLITSLCSAPGSCTPVAGTLLSGYIRFVDNVGTQPTTADAEQPTGSAATHGSVGVLLALTSPRTPAVPPVCYAEQVLPVSPATVASARVYYCFVPIDPATGSWTGRSELDGPTPIATLMSEFRSNFYKVCRYIPNAATGGNAAQPAGYTNVKQSLLNQNFLVIAAGNGTLSNPPDQFYLCPGASGPLINRITAPHQPAV